MRIPLEPKDAFMLAGTFRPRLAPGAALLAALFIFPAPAPWRSARAEEEGSVEKDEKTEEDEKEQEAGPGAALREGRYDEAVEGFRKAAGGEGADAARARRGLAEALSAQGKDEEAAVALREAKDLDRSPVLLAGLGRVHLRRGRLADAEKAFRGALAADPSHVESLNRLGEALWKQGRREDARASWEKLIEVYREMSPEDAQKLGAPGFVEMGLALVGLNRFREANDIMFSQAGEIDAKDPDLLLEQGRVFLRKYNWPHSRDALREALDQNPRFADAHAVLADNYLADFQVGTNRYNLAEKSLEKALDVNPNHAEAFTVRGALSFSDGNIGEAAKDFEKAIELDPSSLRARGYLASCRLLQADDDGLRAAETDALAVNPKGAEFFHTVALAIENKFRYQDAVRFCDRALELDPEYWPAFVTLGINCLRTGEEERGRKFLERSWENDKFNVWVYNTRLLLKHMDENYRELKTDRFVFKLPKDDFDLLKMYLVPLLEEAHGKLSAHYKTELPRPIHIEAFSAHKWFSARTVGLEGFAAAGACFGNLVTLTTPRALPQNWGAVAWHEFAHVATLALTKHRVPRWLTEGLSVFEEGRDRPRWARNFEREIADTFASGRLLPIAELDFGFSKPKYPMQILISYFQGCLIAEYIKEKWGFDAILAILKGYGDNKGTAAIFREVLGMSLEEFDKGFFAHLAAWVEKNGYEPAIAPERIPHLQLQAESDPKDARKLVDLAWAYLSSGESKVDASLTANKALELDPANADAHAVLGLLHFEEKNLPAARAELEKALQGGTRFRFRSHSALGTIARRDGQKELAAEHLEKAKAASPRAGATQGGPKCTYYVLADLYMELGKEDMAVRQMEELSAFAPEDPQCRTRIVTHYMKKDTDEGARKAFEALGELTFINPYEKATHEFLARTAARLGEHDVTIREYGYLLKSPDTNPKIAYLALAKAHAAKGEGEKAVEFARKLLEIDAENEDAKAILEKHGK
jgi:tetratricopeptide (TPR) repeat protein